MPKKFRNNNNIWNINYFFIIDISYNFSQKRLWHSGHIKIVVSNPSKYSSGIIKSQLHFLQWFIVINFYLLQIMHIIFITTYIKSLLLEIVFFYNLYQKKTFKDT